MTVAVYVSLGSNLAPEINIRKAIDAMQARFGELRLSPVYRSASVGFNGNDFLNLVVEFSTDKSFDHLVDDIRQLEDSLGRDRAQPRYSDRVIDLDILLFGDNVIDRAGMHIPRQEIVVSAHVLKPLQDLNPQGLHPVNGRSFNKLWRELSEQAPPLVLVDLNLN